MKKKLETDLMSIAHRVLQIKNKSDINQLYVETQKLYEKLSILRFVEEHFGETKPTIGQAEIVEKMKQFFEENHLSDIKLTKPIDGIVVEEVLQEEIVSDDVVANETLEDIEKEIKEEKSVDLDNDINFHPVFELDVEVEEEEIEAPKKTEAIQISFEDILVDNYLDTLFVKADQEKEYSNQIIFNDTEDANFQNKKPIAENTDIKTDSLNDKLSKGLNIDLNDKIAFVKHLFNNSDEDYNRVLNQLITYDSFDEAQNFIEDMVKPDYNNWGGKEDYAQRFIEIIQKKFP